MRLLIDGTDYGIGTDIVGDIVVEHQKSDEGGTPTRSFTEEITAFDAAFDYLKALFVDDPNGKFNSASITLVDDCCGEDRVVFTGIVFGESVEWCEGDCFLKFRAIEDTDITRKLDCIKSTPIYDNHDGFQQQQHPRMVYCVEYRPSVLQDIVMIFGIILGLNLLVLSPLLLAIAAIVTVVNLIIAVVNQIPGVDIQPLSIGNDSQGILGQINSFLVQINSLVVGCGRRHPSPLVREYIDNVCRKCGIQWSSTIFKDPSSDYFNTVLYNAPIEKGKRPTFNPNGAITTWIDENKPIDTLETFLDKLRIVFNAEWRIGEDGVLRFERKDFFWQNGDWVDYEAAKADNRVDEVICYSWRQDDAPAVLNMEYSLDAVDWVGNEALNRFNEIVEWNQPLNPRQKGIRDVLIPFGVARFRDDGIDRDVIGDYGFWPAYASTEQVYRGVIIQNNGTSFQPKLLIWDGQSINFGKVRKYGIPFYNIVPAQNYNFPYSATDFNAAPATIYPTNHPNSGIYTRFYSIDNPKVLADQGKTFTFTFKFTCDELADFDLDRNVLTPIGSGRITTVTINYTKRIAQVTGNV
jgi:hypothetical protein